MSTKKWKDNEINTLLMEKWGYKKKKTDEARVVDPELDIDHVIDEEGEMSIDDIADFSKEDPPEWIEADKMVDSITNEIDRALMSNLEKVMNPEDIAKLGEAVKLEIEEKLLDMALEIVKKGGQENA